MLKRILPALGLCFAALVIFSANAHSSVSAQSATVIPIPTAASLTCQDIVSRALTVLQNSCDTLGRNNACYGNDNIRAELTNADFSFQRRGDKVPIGILKTVSTSPLNQSAGTWGLSLLKLQANLRDTLPGQNVTFLVFGDTSVQNVSGDMRAFYFTTGLSAPTCDGVPYDSIVVRSPDHEQVTFNANGVTITIASTIRLKAIPNQSMTVQLIEGHATVATPKGSRTLQPSQSVSISMGGPTGLEPQGIPAPPVDAPPDTTTLKMLSSLDTLTGAKVSIPISGCITANSGDSMTIDGIPIQMNTGHLGGDPLNVGDCVTANGDIQTDGSLVLVSTPRLVVPIVITDNGNGGVGNSGTGSSGGGGGGGGQGNNNSGTGDDKGKGGDRGKGGLDNGKGNGGHNNGNGNGGHDDHGHSWHFGH